MWQLFLVMIQRVQTIYLLLSGFLSGGAIFFLNLWKNEEGIPFYIVTAFSQSNLWLKTALVLFVISTLLAFIAIFKFKSRKTQFVLGRLIILINFILLGFFVYFSQNLSGEIKISEKGIGLLIPILVIVLTALANRAIKKDEALVKSADRLR